MRTEIPKGAYELRFSIQASETDCQAVEMADTVYTDGKICAVDEVQPRPQSRLEARCLPLF